MNSALNDKKIKFQKMRSKYGNITIDGNPESPSYTASMDDEDFWEYIEDGIKPMVKLFYDFGLTTVSSCQGHEYDDGYDELSGKRSIEANVKFLSNDIIDFIIFDTLEKLKLKELIFERSEYIYIGYTSHFSLNIKNNRKLIDEKLEIIRLALLDAFTKNKDLLNEAIAQGYHNRRNFDNIEDFVNPSQVFNPGDEGLDSITRVRLLRYFLAKEKCFDYNYNEKPEDILKSLKGKYGNITIDGSPESISPIISIKDKYFWSFIEEDIKPLVEVFLKHGLVTVSSCEGHEYEENYDIRRGQRSVNAHIRFLMNRHIRDMVSDTLKGLDYVQVEESDYVHGLGRTAQITFNTIDNRDKLREEIMNIARILSEMFNDNMDLIHYTLKKESYG